MTEKLNKIYCGDALETLKTLPAESVNCVITSPPYYGLRDYGVAGQIGLENSPEKYIENPVNVFMECHRILKNDGTMWIVIGDSYAGSGRGKGDINRKSKVQNSASFTGDIFSKPYKLNGYKNKDLMGVPWSLAFELRKCGWYLRQDIIWHKPNPMPESVTDRCTKSHEYIFLFSKLKKYYFDHAAMLEPAKYDNRKEKLRKPSEKYLHNATGLSAQGLAKGGYRWQSIEGNFVRNRRDVWCIPTKPCKEAHFATYPPDLIKPCISAGCPENGTVLDPFMGAGTTAIVAKKLGRNCTGIELNRNYIEIAEKRMKM